MHQTRSVPRALLIYLRPGLINLVANDVGQVNFTVLSCIMKKLEEKWHRWQRKQYTTHRRFLSEFVMKTTVLGAAGEVHNAGVPLWRGDFQKISLLDRQRYHVSVCVCVCVCVRVRVCVGEREKDWGRERREREREREREERRERERERERKREREREITLYHSNRLAAKTAHVTLSMSMPENFSEFLFAASVACCKTNLRSVSLQRNRQWNISLLWVSRLRLVQF